MTRVMVTLREHWQELSRHTSMTVKSLVISALIATVFWLITDLWQTTQVANIFRQKLLNDIDIQAQRDRIRLDQYIRAQEQSVRLLAYLQPLVNRVSSMEKNWRPGHDLPTQWGMDNRPPWMPPTSVTRGLVSASYVLLLDAQKQLREVFFLEENSPLPTRLLESHLPELLVDGEHSHIMAADDGIVYLINTSDVLVEKTSTPPKGFLVTITILNDEFLSIFHDKTETNSITAFIHGETNRVFASSQPDKIQVGILLDRLTTKYMIFGKKFLDYNFSIHIPVHFATFIPLEEISSITAPIVQAERQQRAVGYAIVAGVFFVLIYFIAKKVQDFTEGMVTAAVAQLGLKKKAFAAGDQLLIMGEQFHWMIQEILQARRHEAAHQEELKLVNDSLLKSLIITKRTQAELVEAEKMASLGSLVAGVAHEINTPVGIGVTAISFLKQESQKCVARFENGTLSKSELASFFNDVEESAQITLQNLDRAAKLVRSFKQVAVDRTSEARGVFRINDCINDTLLSLQPQLKKTKLKVTVHCPETLTIQSYPGAFSQIITNFIGNSILHGFQEQEPGEILFQVGQTADHIFFRYSDNGCGMKEEDRLRIFEPFFTTARHRGGSGLGLHVVFNLVNQTLKGTIQCTSSPGQGIRHEILIPISPKTAEV